jgi:hypothetical protein
MDTINPARERSISIAVLTLSSMIVASGCESMCGNHEIARVTSPGSRFDAVLFQRSCGATTGFSTQVSVVPVGTALADVAGNVFIADDDHGRAPTAGWGGPPAHIEWSDGQRLTVRYARDARVFRQARVLQVKTGWLAREQVAVDFQAE